MEKGTIVPVLPFLGAIYASTFPGEGLENLIAYAFGTWVLVSPEIPFSHSNYYSSEMGPGLSRRMFGFGNLVDPSHVLEIKDQCRSFEQEHSQAGKRTINLDPGYLDLYKVVLLSEKYSGRKIYLGRGFYADLTLLYQNGTFIPQPRAFPDFQSGIHTSFFLELRNIYLRMLPG